MNKFVIFNFRETQANDGEPMFWSDFDGWGHLYNATVYSFEERRSITHLPSRDSIWVKLPLGLK